MYENILQELKDACDLATDKRTLERLCGQASVEIGRLRHELQMAKAQIERLQGIYGLHECANDLTEIVRMPNAEYIADAHNAAVRKIRAAAGCDS